MAGIYIHIPYCKVKCHYCDFHFSTNAANKEAMLNAMLVELVSRKAYLENQPVETIYFGGGTPSFVGPEFIDAILKIIQSNFNVSNDAEITLECNPDDINQNNLIAFQKAGVNRLSIGIQSFDDKILSMMNRAHSSTIAIKAVNLAHEIGFTNITADLIYGVPQTNLYNWQKELETFDSLNITHLSAYCLTIEPKTYFGAEYKKGNLKIIADEIAIEQFEYLMTWAALNNYEHYEISNFAKPGYLSKHNTAYWLNKHYLGIGPSAHSYNGVERSWNISNNNQYIKNLNEQKKYNDAEVLSQSDKCNDYILTRLRTKWGIDLTQLSSLAGSHYERIHQEIIKLEKKQLLEIKSVVCTLTQKGKLQADGIASALFM